MSAFNFIITQTIYYPAFGDNDQVKTVREELGAFSTKQLAIEYVEMKKKKLFNIDPELKFDLVVNGEKIVNTKKEELNT